MGPGLIAWVFRNLEHLSSLITRLHGLGGPSWPRRDEGVHTVHARAAQLRVAENLELSKGMERSAHDSELLGV